jgi:hypothetical protein
MNGNAVRSDVAILAALLLVSSVSIYSAIAEEDESAGLILHQPSVPVFPTERSANLSNFRPYRPGAPDPVYQQHGFFLAPPKPGLALPLDGLKLLGWKRPGANPKSIFDIAIELNGLGIQLEDQNLYGYLRAARTLSDKDLFSIQFRYRY